MMKKLVDGFPDDRDMLSNQLLSGLLRVRAAEKSPDPQFKVQEINKLLTTIIHLPLKVQQSCSVLVQSWFSPGSVLVQSWFSPGSVLVQSWGVSHSLGTLL
ncbi:hypothetical protein NQD34_013179 [Periophthalmus magnuspinnatus]|nr:hypothetical protein NQD34_013179 [Periophthalmus magnuspinnatus]